MAPLLGGDGAGLELLDLSSNWLGHPGAAGAGLGAAGQAAGAGLGALSAALARGSSGLRKLFLANNCLLGTKFLGGGPATAGGPASAGADAATAALEQLLGLLGSRAPLLSHLDLSENVLGDAGVQVVLRGLGGAGGAGGGDAAAAAAAAAFPALETVELRYNAVSVAGAKAARGALPQRFVLACAVPQLLSLRQAAPV